MPVSMIGGSAFPAPVTTQGNAAGIRVLVSYPLRVMDADQTPFGFSDNGRISITQGNTAPERQAILAGANRAVDLTGATVQYRLDQTAGTFPVAGAKTVRGAATMPWAGGGVVAYHFQPTDTNIPGIYEESWRVTWANGDVSDFIAGVIVILAAKP